MSVEIIHTKTQKEKNKRAWGESAKTFSRKIAYGVTNVCFEFQKEQEKKGTEGIFKVIMVESFPK